MLGHGSPFSGKAPMPETLNEHRDSCTARTQTETTRFTIHAGASPFDLHPFLGEGSRHDIWCLSALQNFVLAFSAWAAFPLWLFWRRGVPGSEDKGPEDPAVAFFSPVDLNFWWQA